MEGEEKQPSNWVRFRNGVRSTLRSFYERDPFLAGMVAGAALAWAVPLLVRLAL